MKNNDLISRSVLLERIKHVLDETLLSQCDAKSVYELIEAMVDVEPAVDAEPVRHGQWVHLGPNFDECPVCKERVSIFSGGKNYCPNCGAKMDMEVKT